MADLRYGVKLLCYGVCCAHCGSTEGIATVQGKKKSHRAGLYYCNACHGQFTVTVGTVMEQSHVPLNKWLLGFYLMCASKKGYSAHQLHRTIKVSYKTAWFMAHRIREAMRSGGLMPPMGGAGGIVEADETFIGIKEGTRKAKGGYAHKQVVLSLVERGMKGVYQHCSEKHLHRYLAEFDFRYSNRVKLGVNDEQRAERALKGVVGKRLTYRKAGKQALTGAAD